MDNKYCIYCGTENSRQAGFCVKCGKEMNPKENLLIDFLVKRTKDKFKGSAEDSLYEAVKNFLLSHLYGTALTVSFVSALVTTVSAIMPQVTRMSNEEIMHYLERGYLNGGEHIREETGAYPVENNRAVHALISSYEMEALADVLRDASGNYITPNPQQYRLPSSYGYGGVHELSSDLPDYIDGASMSGTTNKTEFDRMNFQTDIARKLYDDGYTVGECVAERQFEDDGQIVAEYSFIVVAVLVDDQWKVAQDQILYMNLGDKDDEKTNRDVDAMSALEVASDYVDYISQQISVDDLRMSSSLGYQTQHQLTYDDYLVVVPDETDCETQYTTFVNRNEFSNNASVQLYDDGYTVVEFLFHQYFYDITTGSYLRKGEREIYLTCVLIDGQWYIAEDILESVAHYDPDKYNEEQEPVIINIDDVSEMASEYARTVFTGGDAGAMRTSMDFGFETQHLLTYYAPLDFDSSVVDTHKEYGVYTLADGFVNNASTVLFNDGYTVGEYWAREEFTDKSSGKVLGYREYRITCVLLDGQWQVAEDVGIASEVY